MTLNEHAQQWLTDLRSGEFQQGKFVLKSGELFCCLGVACERYRREHGGEWENDGFRDLFMERDAGLPEAVQEWLGLTDDLGVYDFGALTALNDHGVSFAAIADLIESEPPGLFVAEPS
jgi:hypothetical protein